MLFFADTELNSQIARAVFFNKSTKIEEKLKILNIYTLYEKSVLLKCSITKLELTVN